MNMICFARLSPNLPVRPASGAAWLRQGATLLLATAMLTTLATPAMAQKKPVVAAQTGEVAPEPIVLREGDELAITFPGAPSLNATQRIRSDGRITLDLLGEIVATGMSPMQFQDRLIELYSGQLVSREITVRVVSRLFYVYVNGSVDTHGRMEFDRPVSALEAVMAAGFTDGSVNLKNVRVTRVENGMVRTFGINLEAIIDGKPVELVMLKQGDMILVPARVF